MKKGICAFLLLLLCALPAFAEDVVTIEASDAAKEKKEALFAAGERNYFLEENFSTVLEKLYAKEAQTFPDVELKNTLEKEICDGNDVYTLSNGEYESIVLYIHGGAWVFDIDEYHVGFCDELVDRLHAKVYMPLYPLAPQHTYEEAYTMLVDLYESLLAQGKPVYVMGDSAGGNISLCLMNLCKEKGLAMPDKLVLLHPCADMTFTNPDMEAIEEGDPVLAIYGCRECAKLWAGDTELSDPSLSPLYADLSGYPDTMLFVGSCDILCPDDLLLYDKMLQAGNDITLVKGEGLWHVFSIFNLPEKETSLDLITDFCANAE